MRRLVLMVVLLFPFVLATAASAAPKKKHPAPPPDKTEESEKASDDTNDESAPDAADAGAPSSASASEADAGNGRVEGADETLDTVEGIDACNAFVVKNAHDMGIWEKTQPPVPYTYPARKTFLDAPWTPITKLDGDSGMLLLATFVPHINAMVRGATPVVGFSWPLEFPVGPAFWCTRKKGSYDVFKYRPVRLVLEPGLYAEQPVTFWVRPAARFIWHPTAWFFGAGLGAGSTLEVVGKEPFRASLSPEAVVTFGRCCNPGYFTLAVRHDFFFAGKTQTTTASIGFTYF